MERYELVEGKSSKFWEVDVQGANLTVRFGRIGTNGQTLTKSFSNADAAAKEREKLVREKAGKGYSLKSSNGERLAATPANAPAPAASAPAEPAQPSAPAQSPAPTTDAAETSAPRDARRASADEVAWTPAFRKHALARLDLDVPALRVDAQKTWEAMGALDRRDAQHWLDRLDAAGQARARALHEHLQSSLPPSLGTPADEAFLLQLLRSSYRNWDSTYLAIDYWVARADLSFALNALLAAFH